MVFFGLLRFSSWKNRHSVVETAPPQAAKDRKGEKARELQRAQAGRGERVGLTLGFADEL